MGGWYGVDLDGTLAVYERGHGVQSVGEPVSKMAERVRQWLAEGKEVRIVTARVSPEWDDVLRQTRIIEDWCLRHFGQELKVQCHKDGSMLELWDDRAVGVIPNTGQTLMEAGEAIGMARAIRDIATYDLSHGNEGDAQAGFEPEQRWENGYGPGNPNPNTICVDFPGVTVDGVDLLSEIYISPREARCLAATLLRAAQEAEGYDNLLPHEKDYP